MTPTSKTGKQELFVSEKKDGESFKVSVENGVEEDISFDWFIVNSD